ncbi:Na(+)/H(+) antiporter subunit E [BD1-7 clade bacterium]|uniref:Na(+)/H(+) antiporter subunit E n=1 Tax=BD1-7 clade bacterium TaxID=2029982 RepID=A0A5S9PI36_9GAMM|nr:Na(+)/H(+) antiporter subunit E [BD1-7 clade bacterium]CAA0103877.1 Na(+)/H(+) antiporter subunit E [BD1-7 clade bacterium]
MNVFLLNILLALGWMVINGQYQSTDFLVGFVVGFLSLWLTEPFRGKPSYGRKVWAAIELFVVFLYQLLTSSLQVVWDVITPQHLSDPAIINVPMDVKSDMQIMLLANIVSLTPGTLTLNVSDCRQYLIVHAMFGSDKQAVIDDIKHTFERRILEVTRD